MSRALVSLGATPLRAVAFGDTPGHWPLPPAHDPQQRWLRAVAAGGQGHYAAARAELALVRRETRTGPLAALAHSTEGSLLRQLGWHRLARGWDGRALLLAGDDPVARLDALVGLAADALGLGRFAAAARLLVVARAQRGPENRSAIRIEWVSAELAMARGEPETALTHAHSAVALAADAGSVRHRIKSDVVLAAALCSGGRVPEARAVADDLLVRTEQHGLVPLRWAVASLLDGIGSEAFSGAQIRLIRESAAHTVSHRGGRWCPR